MALNPGARIGPYEVTGTLGAGGMGEVYRARDTRLKRDVALKVLPAAFASDPDRLARFRREAELLATLNHPHIAAIYGLEQTEAGTALALELVDGETLAERIARGPIPLDETLAIARQLAEALEAAHDHGIIHRDLKPANIKVTPDNVVKVLDFGLAKWHEPNAPNGPNVPNDPFSMSPTITSPAMMTGVGMILGTAAYMAPEQAKGREADKRSDVWGFGCVLFEMLTGRRAFQGDDVAETLAGVLRGEPAWSALPGDLPPPLIVLLRRCLEKDRGRRIGDAAAALRVVDDTIALTTASRTGAGHDTRSRLPIGIAVAAVILVAAVSSAVVWMTMRPNPPRVSRLLIAPDAVHALVPTGQGRNVAISRDGSRIAWVGANGTLMLRSLDQLEPTILVRQDNPIAPFFSADGQWVGYFPGNRALRKVPITGGPTVVLSLSDSGGPGGATWGDDGSVVFATNNRATGLLMASADATTPRVLTTPDRQRGEADHLWPEFLPGGRAVLFTITSTTRSLENAQVAVFDLDTGTYQVVMPGGTHAHYVPTGHLVYKAGANLRAVGFDLERRETRGAPAQVVSAVLGTADGAADFEVAADGTLVYVPGGVAARRQFELVWVARDGTTEALRGAPVRGYLYPRISADGTKVLLDIRDQDNDVWLWDVRRETLTNLTRNPSLDRFPIWAPDGKHFIFVSDRDGGMSAMYRQAADGTGEAERLSEPSPTQQTPNGMSQDGKRVIFDRDDDVLMLDLDGSRRVTPLLHTASVESRAALSPDGRWLAYYSNESGQPEIYVRPFPLVNAGKTQISTAGGIQPWWDRTGSELLYVTSDGSIMSVRVGSGQTWSASPPALVAAGAFNFTNPTSAPTFDLSADGRRILMVREITNSGQKLSSPSLVVIQNWTEELKRLVPEP